MSEPEPEFVEICPDCGEDLWYDAAAGCWICENCGGEFEAEDWEDWGDEEDQPEEQGSISK